MTASPKTTSSPPASPPFPPQSSTPSTNSPREAPGGTGLGGPVQGGICLCTGRRNVELGDHPIFCTLLLPGSSVPARSPRAVTDTDCLQPGNRDHTFFAPLVRAGSPCPTNIRAEME